MLGFKGDDLTVFCLFVSLAVFFGWEAMKETRARRWVLAAMSVGCIVTTMFWFDIKETAPGIAGGVTQIAKDPKSWFFLILAAVLVFILDRRILANQGGSVTSAPAPASAQSVALDPPGAPMVDDPDGEAFYEGDHEDLMLFVVDHLLPTIDAQLLVQRHALEFAIPKRNLSELAVRGAWGNSTNQFTESFDLLDKLRKSPPPYVQFDDMAEAVRLIEIGYIPFCAKGALYALVAGNEVWSTAIFADAVSMWRAQHDELIRTYEPFRRNSKIPILFRPGMPSRFGQSIPQGSLHVPANH